MDDSLAAALRPEVIEAILSVVPDAWLASDLPDRSADDTRTAYTRHLRDRLVAPRPFLPEARRAH